jgi:hypothetical protein
LLTREKPKGAGRLSTPQLLKNDDLSEPMIAVNSRAARSPSDIACVPIGAAACVEVDPWILGTDRFRYPDDPRLASELSDEIFDLFCATHVKSPSVWTRLLLSRSRIAPVLGIALAVQNLARQLMEKPCAGLFSHPEKPRLSFPPGEIDGAEVLLSIVAVKQRLADHLQRLLFAIIDLFKLPRPVLQIYDESIERGVAYRWKWRLRAFRRVLGVPSTRSAEDDAEASRFVEILCEELRPILARHGIELSADEDESVRKTLKAELTIALDDFNSLKRWLGRRKFDYYGGSVCNYTGAILALVARASGGEAHSQIHGGNVYGNTFSANVTEFLNATTAWVPSKQAADNARVMMAMRCPEAPTAAVRVQSENPLLGYDKPGAAIKTIRTVLVMGSPVVLQYSASGALPAPCYIDAETRLVNFLVKSGYEVIYKPHPENTWRDHAAIMSSKARVEYRAYEEIGDACDAVIYIFHISSTLITDLGSSRHVFLFGDGWHETFWLPQVWDALRDRCVVIPGAINDRNRIAFDADYLLTALRNPRPVDHNAFRRFIGAEAVDVLPAA